MRVGIRKNELGMESEEDGSMKAGQGRAHLSKYLGMSPLGTIPLKKVSPRLLLGTAEAEEDGDAESVLPSRSALALSLSLSLSDALGLEARLLLLLLLSLLLPATLR